MKKKKRNFCELQIMVDEIDKSKHMLFGSLSSAVSHNVKQVEWQKAIQAVNAVSSEPWTLEENKNKWSDFKREAKK